MTLTARTTPRWVCLHEEEFYRLLLQLLSYGTTLAVERQTWYGTLTCRESITRLCDALRDTTYSRAGQTPAAKSHPFGSNTLLSSICATW